MKYLILAAGLLLSGLSQAQQTRSVAVSGNVLTNEQGRQRILDREHDLPDMTLSVSSTTGTIGTVGNFTSKVVPYGWQADVNTITITSDGPVSLSGYIRKGNGSSGNEKSVTPLNFVLGANGGQMTFPVNATIYGGGHILLVTTMTTTTRPTIKLFATGKMIGDDRRYDAPLTFTMIGNSISWGTLGNRALGGGYPNHGRTHFARRVNAALRTAGIDVRPSLRGIGGSQARDWIRNIDAGIYDDQPLNLVGIMLGTNEAADGDSTLVEASSGMKYSEMMQYIIDWVYARNPPASVVLIGPPHSSTTPRITNLPSIRAATAALVSLSKYSRKDLKYYDPTAGTYAIAAPTVSNDDNYVEVGVGTHVHLRGDTGHLKLFQGLWPVIQSTQFYINNVKLSKPLDAY